MKISQRLKDEDAFVFSVLPGVICERCGAKLTTMNNVCTTDLLDPCPGFLAIDEAKRKFNEGYKP